MQEKQLAGAFSFSLSSVETIKSKCRKEVENDIHDNIFNVSWAHSIRVEVSTCKHHIEISGNEADAA